MSAESQSISDRPQGSAWSAGLALFSMFFGAGNLIFPLLLGQKAGMQTPAALVGLGISAVLFPLLGMVAMTYYQGDSRAFLGRLGKWPAFFCLLILNLVMGPLGVTPRLFTLMHASAKVFWPELPFLPFSLALCVVIFFLTYKPHRIISVLGTALTPLLLLTLAVIVYAGAIHAPGAADVSESGWYFALEGLKGGYQMMDLVASVLFSSLIISHFTSGSQTGAMGRGVFKKTLMASCIAAGLLMVTYVGLGWVAAHHGRFLPSTIAPEEILNALSYRLLGSWGAVVAAGAVFLACLTTAISIASVFSSYLRHDLCRDKVHPHVALVGTLLSSVATATLGFSGIMRLMAPLLDMLYPALIALCLVNIGHRVFHVQSVRAPVFFVLGFAAGGLCLG
jgi:LIVCS family branched-chain amino acid:cation transporter